MQSINLFEQLEQSNTDQTIKVHISFVRFCVFLNLCADTVQAEPKLLEQLSICFFNQFLIDILQERLLSDSVLTQRTALQYFD
jgi:hypothetical protein